jgi:nitrogen regulatory protein P-II 2
MGDTARVRLVTVIAAFETEERLLRDLKGLGVKGFTLGKVEGRGLHGRRMSGLTDAPNLHVEMLVDRELAARILERVARSYADQPVLAYVYDVDAVPVDHFT